MTDTDRDTLTIAPAKIDEAARRRTPFLGGEPIVLADGQPYSFAKPFLEFAPRFTGSTVTAVVTTSLGHEFDEAATAFDTACQAASEQAAGEPGENYTGPSSIDAMMTLAVIMLRINYTLSNDELATILRWRPDNSESEFMWASIQDVARGVAPKPKADGSDSP